MYWPKSFDTHVDIDHGRSEGGERGYMCDSVWDMPDLSEGQLY